MTPQNVRHFLTENTDFRRAPLFGIFLLNPYLLATATYDRGYIMNHVLPQVPTIPEESVWELGRPDTTVVLARNNIAPTLLIQDWSATRVPILGAASRHSS